MSKDKVPVIIVHESIANSWATDASTFAMFLALIGIGWALGSDAMQWVGGIIGFIMVASRAADKKTSRRFTIAEARAELDKIEAGKC